MVDDFSKVVELAGKNSDQPAARFTLRSMRDQADYDLFIQLERRVWGQDFAECVPTSMLMVAQKVGGLAAGAFTESGELHGLIYGLTGIRDGELTHWSHIMAVDDRARNLGLGTQMKLFQREFLQRMGVSRVLWTYDPLESKNAHLNMNHLGALPIDYVRNLYGEGEASGLFAGIGTDRFIVSWLIDSPRVARILEQPQCIDPVPWRDTPIVNTDAQGQPLLEDVTYPEVPRVRMEVPYDIQSTKNEGPGVGQNWRRCTRNAFEFYMNRGWSVTCTFRDDSRSYYGLSQQEAS